ncbi:MAG: VWA domain-containing protein [Opitutaceae bacterium]
MNWADAHWLRLLLLPGAGALLLIAMKIARRRETAIRWPGIKRVVAAGAHVLSVSAGRSLRRPWLLLAACACVVVALARPRWGEIEKPVYQQAREVMIALDLSRSMLVQDVAPNRLSRAKLLVQSLLDGLRGERVGLIVFAGTAFVQVPLSADYQILHEFLPELKPGYMPQGGTDYAGMLSAATGGFSDTANTDRYLIILSDGGALDEVWKQQLPDLEKRGVRVIALGAGTPEGGFIPDEREGFVKDQRGAVVLSRLESGTLRQLARETGGAYRDASTWVDLAALLQETVELGRRGDFTEEKSVEHIERFQWFLAPAALLAALGLWREIAVRPQARNVTQKRPTGKTRRPSRNATRLKNAHVEFRGAQASRLPVWASRTNQLDARLRWSAKVFGGTPNTAGGTPALPGMDRYRLFQLWPVVIRSLFVGSLLAASLAYGAQLAAAQQTVAPPHFAPASDPAVKVRETITRLAAAPQPTAADWLEVAQRTLAYGQSLRQAGAPLEKGAIHDALAAVALGERADPALADWAALRSALEELLKEPPKPEDQQQQQQQNQEQQQKNQQNQQQQQQNQSGSDQSQDQQEQQQQNENDSSRKQDAESENSSDPQQNQQQQQQQPQTPQQPAPEEGRLGELDDQNEQQNEPAEEPRQSPQPQPAPRPKQQPTRKIGGKPADDRGAPPSDPEMAAALQRLREVKEDDAPARLFQLLEGENTDKPKGGQDW